MSACLTDDHKVWGWGKNDSGQLCTSNTYTTQWTPKEMPFPEREWDMLCCGRQHLIVSDGREIYGCGNN
eukprot:375797-Prorocentrum_lima.AAC.1